MTPVDSISSIDICADCISLAFVASKYVCLMSARMGSENCVLIDIVSIGTASTGVVFGKA